MPIPPAIPSASAGSSPGSRTTALDPFAGPDERLLGELAAHRGFVPHLPTVHHETIGQLEEEHLVDLNRATGDRYVQHRRGLRAAPLQPNRDLVALGDAVDEVDAPVGEHRQPPLGERTRRLRVAGHPGPGERQRRVRGEHRGELVEAATVDGVDEPSPNRPALVDGGHGLPPRGHAWLWCTDAADDEKFATSRSSRSMLVAWPKTSGVTPTW